MSHQHRIIEDTVYFWFASNDISGSGDDGASPVYDVRLAGEGGADAPILSGSATLLTHANFPPGCHEIAIAATSGNGFSAGNTYAIFCTLSVDSQNPTGFIGSFSLEPIIADVRELDGVVQSLTDLKNFADSGYDPATNKVEGVKLVDTTTTLADNAITPAKYNDAAAYIPYAGGIWIDSGAANTNTVVGVDGLPSNPVSTFLAARTLADAIGLKKYYIINHSNLTLAATHQDWTFEGIGLRNRINMGGEDVNDSFFYHIILSGTQGGNQKIEAKCSYLNGITDLNIIATNVWLTGNNTLKATTLSIIDHWSSNVPGQSTPELTFQAGETSIGLRHGSGGIKVNNMTSDHTMSLETDGQLVVDATCNSGNISARGSMDITDNGTAMNITKTAVWNTSQSIQSVTDDVGITQAGADKVFGSSGAAIPEPSAGAPAATPKPREVFGWLWAHFRNKSTLNKTTGEAKVYNDAGSVIAKGTDTDDGTTFTKGELGTP